MNFYRFLLFIKCIFFMSSSTAFDILRVDFKDRDKIDYGNEVLLHNVDKCVLEYEQWGVTYDRMKRYSRNPVKWRRDDNDVFDCAWGCFFLKMEWLDEDMEGTFQPPIILADLEKYIISSSLELSRKIASRCVYVNFPHTKKKSGHVLDCEQAKLLKDCLIKDEVLEITKKNKVQFISLMRDWLRVCADMEGLTLAEILDRAWHPPSKPLPVPEPPALYGCPWRCLFYDMGWLEDVKGVLEVSVMRETIKLYYNETDRIPELLDHATRCAFLANEYRENPDIHVRPHGCDRSQILVDCLVTSFFKNTTVVSANYSTEDTGRNFRIGRGGPARVLPGPARSPLRSARRPPRPALSPAGTELSPTGPALSPAGPALSLAGPALHPPRPALSPPYPALSPPRPALSPPRKLGPPHHVRSRLHAQVVPLEPSDSIFVKVNITES